MRYLAALAVVAIAVVLRLWLDPIVERSGFAIFLVGMLIAAWVGGLGPCLIAQTLILFAQGYWFSPTHEVHSPMTVQGIISLLAFYSVGGIVAVLSEAWSSAYQRARAQQKEAMAQREQMLTTVSCIADAVLVTDADARLVLMNPAAEALTGWSIEESRGRPVRDVFVVYDAQQIVESPVRRVLRGGAAVQQGLRQILTTRNDRRVPVSYSAAPIRDAAGNTSGIVLVFRDETERLRTERALKNADKRKDNFLATLAHELRNPLAPISMGLELLKTAADDAEMAAEVRTMMERQTRQMVRLIDDLLDISRITRGKLELQKSQTVLSDAVRDAVDATRALYEEAKHLLVVKLPKDEVSLYADPHRLTQVITNLLSNAAKYTPPGGRVELTAELHSGELVLAVSDNGCGIASDKLETIFDMFSQGDGAKERGHQGLGIGLNLVKRLVEMHGGNVVAESDGLHQGSRFVARLPVLSSTTQPVRGVSPPSAAASGRVRCRVLVVDDNADARASLSMLVKMQGCEVFQAQDGQEAIEAAERLKPAIVLMDIGMPRLNGYQAARRIRQEPWGEEMLLAATTGWGQAEDRRRSHEAGFDHHLVKPVDPAVLTELLAVAESSPLRVRERTEANHVQTNGAATRRDGDGALASQRETTAASK